MKKNCSLNVMKNNFETEILISNLIRYISGGLFIIALYSGGILWTNEYYPKYVSIILFSVGIVAMLSSLIINRLVDHFVSLNKRVDQLEKDNGKMAAIVRHNMDKVV